MVPHPGDEQPSRRARDQRLVSDVPGIRTVEAHLDTRTLSVSGTADATAMQTAIRRAGYEAIILSHRLSGQISTGTGA